MEFAQQLAEWRHYLHAHPEPAMEERETAAFVAARLRKMGYQVHEGVGGTGVVACLTNGPCGDSMAIRADMDCIGIEERTGLAYSSVNPGRMHACGHDGHMTMALGAAQLVAERRDFAGTVVFVFQPGEEPGLGARAMIDDGLFDRFPVTEIYGLHGWPGLPQGVFGVREGRIMAGEDDFVIRIQGRGGHAARPHMTHDALIAAAEVVLSLQTVVSRSVDPAEPAVLSCTSMHSDGTANVIPGSVTITGDCRSFSREVSELIERRMREICGHICAAHETDCRLDYERVFKATVNDRICAKYALEAARAVAGHRRVKSGIPPNTVAEDFSAYLELVPGCFTLIGNGEDSPNLHTADYNFRDENLVPGAKFFAELVRRRMPQAEAAPAEGR
ncbi:MAG: M20 aminoacylase family protein [Desulfovibrionaceae bacterium]|nr:M20 aminoacylase family protein [Desulfovibrionaceae bacterium]